MIETGAQDGKNSDRRLGAMWVVAGALMGPNATSLMHRRPLEKHHGGLWEFPGGKVEPAEMPVAALVRELEEELGIVVEPGACIPAGFAEDRRPQGQSGTVVLLYTIAQWQGEPRAIEGEAIGWFTPDEIARLETPPLDRELADRLFAPR